MSPYDAWAFARLRVGHTLNGEVDRVSDLYRLMARRMAKATGDDRDRIWSEGLETLPVGEADALREAVASADPDAPAPEEGDEWPPLRLGTLPPVDPFPLDVLPDPVARFAADAARAVGCDVGLVAGPVLAIASGLIGRSTSLQLGDNWFASPCIFLANVAMPGDGKSPCLRYAMEPVRRIDLELAEEFANLKEAYQEKLKADKDSAGPPPVPRRVVVEDTTMEACARALAANPRGVLMSLDELSTLITGLNQYKGGRGNDRSNLLKMWSGSSVLIDRVRNEFGEPIRIPHPHLSIAGNLPPALLGELAGGRGDDGLIDRWLFVFPDRKPKLKSAQRRPVSNKAIKAWVEVAMRLWDRQLDQQERRPCPHVISFSAQGKAEFDRLNDEQTDEVNAAEFPDWLRGPWSKLEEYAGRFCLILVMLRHAADPDAGLQPLPTVGPAVAHDAWRLVAYFKRQHRRVRAYLQGKGLGGAPEGAKLILNWIGNHPERDSFSGSDLTRAYPPSRGYDRATMEDGLLWLRDRNAIRLAPAPGRPEGVVGRKPSPTWQIHPETPRAQENQGFQQNGAESAENPDSPAPHPSSGGDRWP
jgi:hypothetical protein